MPGAGGSRGRWGPSALRGQCPSVADGTLKLEFGYRMMLVDCYTENEYYQDAWGNELGNRADRYQLL